MKMNTYLGILIMMNIPFALFAGRDDSLASRIERIKTYQEDHYSERMHMRVDKDLYLAGEFLRFGLTCLNTDSREVSLLSQVAYVELLDTGHNSLLQAKIKLHKGHGNGQIFIPSNMASGNYLLRSYTNWMKNEGPASFEHTIVTIINTFQKPDLPVASVNQPLDLQFYPEGGQLVYGLRSRVAYKCTGKPDIVSSLSGSIMDDLGNEILNLSPGQNAIGSFYFTPEDGRSYQARIITGDSSVHLFNFPAILSEGTVLHVTGLEKEEITVEVWTNTAELNNKINLAGISANRIRILKTISLNKGYGKLTIPVKNLGPGVVQLILTGSGDRSLIERCVYLPPERNYHIEIEPDQEIYREREKVSVRIRATDERGAALDAGLSVSVFSYHTYFDKYRNILFPGLYPDTPESQKMYNDIFEPKGMNYGNADYLDLYMLTSMYESPGAMNPEQVGPSTAYIPEIRNHIIRGTITDPQTDAPAEGIEAYVSIPSKHAHAYVAKSDENGKVYFETYNFYGDNRVVVQTNQSLSPDIRITLDNPFSEEISAIRIPRFDLDPGIQDFIEKAGRNMQVQNAYLKYRPLFNERNAMDSTSFYHGFTQYYLDDYTRFPVMEEVMREYIAGVYVRRNRDGFFLRVLDEGRNETYQESPMLLIDGVPVFDADEVMIMDPLNIERIETVRTRFLKGIMRYSGIVSLFTYDGDLEGFRLNENASIVEYKGIQPDIEYSFPEYPEASADTTQISRFPDYRNVLYWDPLIRTDENGEVTVEFYTSDNLSNYEIRIEGITDDGRPVAGRTFIRVVE